MIKKFLSSELGKGTIILLIMMNLYNFLNFLFHFVMGRMLGPEGYGVLAALMSLVYIYSIPSDAIQNLFSKYASKLNLEKTKGKLKFFLTRYLNKAIILGFAVFFFLFIISFFISKYLGINFWLIITTNIIIISSFATPIVRGILQGRKKFNLFGVSLVIEAVLKIIFSISLVFFGFKVFGAITGVVVGVVSGFIFSLFFNRGILKEKEKEFHPENFHLESIPYFISMGVIILAFSIDILLAQRFFDSSIAGEYAVISMLGKMIFFGTVAISKAMFPLTSERHENKENSFDLFKKSLLLILGLCLMIILIFWLFPEQIISLFYGKAYLNISKLLFYSGISFSLLSISNLVLVYGLSTDRIKKPYLMIIPLVLGLGGLFYFNKTFNQYILGVLILNVIMFMGSIIVVFFKIKKH